MLTWREGLLVVVFKKPLAYFSEKKYELSSRLSHRFTGRTSLDCGKKEIQRERVKNKSNSLSGKKGCFFTRGMEYIAS